MTSMMLSCADWEHSDRQRSEQQIVEAQSGHSVRVQLSSKIKTNFPILLSTLRTMASSREIIFASEAAAVLFDDMSMNGLNGPASPIVVEPGDREGLTTKMPEHGFYMSVPQFY